MVFFKSSISFFGIPAGTAQFRPKDHLVLMLFAGDHYLAAAEFRKLGGHGIHLPGMDKHAFHFGNLVHPAHNPDQPRGGAPAGAGFVTEIGKVPAPETDQGIDRIEAGPHHLTHLAGPQLPAGLGVNDLHNAIIGEMHAVLLHTFKAQTTDIGRPIALPDHDPPFGLDALPKRFGEHFSGHKGGLKVQILFGVESHFFGPCRIAMEKTGSPEKTGDFEVLQGLDLNFGVPHTGGTGPAAQSASTIYPA